MSDPVIRAEGLSKRYRIGARKYGLGARRGYRTFQEAIVDATRLPLKLMGSAFRHGEGPEQEADNAGAARHIWALRGVSFEVNQGEVVGVIGRNGAGKTTLLKILTRITKPTEGRAELKGRVGSLLEVGTGFHPELTGHENVYLYGAILGMDRWEVTRKFDDIVAFAELDKFIDTPVKRYSSGMYMRLAFAVAAHLEPEILLIDEVLAVGDMSFQKRCLGKMRDVAQAGRTVLFVSHNMAAVNSLCGKCILLDQGVVEKIGPTADVISHYKKMVLDAGSDEDAGVGLWRNPDESAGEGARIASVEMLNPDTGDRKNSLTTGDPVTFRLRYRSEIDLKDTSFQFGICTEEDIVLINCMTQRLDGVESPMKVGEGHIDCVFPEFPLAGGSYYIMVGIAHTLVKWFYSSREFGSLTVQPRLDPWGQRARTSDVAYLYSHHRWEVS